MKYAGDERKTNIVVSPTENVINHKITLVFVQQIKFMRSIIIK